MDLPLEVLRTVDFLADGPPELAAQFRDAGHVRDVARGHAFWEAGQPPQGVVVPVSGALAAVRSHPGGREVCYGFFGTGECVGTHSALDGLPHATSARAIGGGAFFSVTRDAFLRFLDEHPVVRTNVVAMVARNCRRDLEELRRIVFLTVSTRLAQFLLERACIRQSDGARVLLRETHDELAGRLGCVREVVARVMAAFVGDGILRRTEHGVFIADWARLRARAARGAPRTPGDARAATPELATKRYFLPVLGGESGRCATEARICGEHLGDLSLCVRRGCPLAVAVGAAAPRAPRVVVARRAALQSAAPARRSAAPVTPTLPTRPATRAVRRLHADDTFFRSPHQTLAIARRVAAYRARVMSIERKYGGVDRAPAWVSLFDDVQVAATVLRPQPPAHGRPSPRDVRVSGAASRSVAPTC